MCIAAPDNHPSLTTPFVPHVSHNPVTRAMAEALGDDKAAPALTNCGRFASVFQRNTRRHLARAYRFVCFLWICEYCGRAGNLLRGFLKDRRHELWTTPQTGLELAGPNYETTEKAAKCLAALLWYKYDEDSIRRPCVPSGNVRMVIKTRTLSTNYVRELLDLWAPEVRVVALRHDHNPLRTLEWMFASTEAVLRLQDAAERVRLFMHWQKGKRMIRTAGKFYSPVELTAEERAERRAELSQQEIADGWEDVAPENRHVQTVEEITDEYVAVEWHCTYNLFRVSHMAAYMTNSGGWSVNSSGTLPAGPSPPS